jgi:Protein of unknown function (DUF3017)
VRGASGGAGRPGRPGRTAPAGPGGSAGPAVSAASAGPAAPAGPAGRAQRAKPPRAAQLPYLIVLGITIAALAWIWHGGVLRAREGTLALAGAMFIGALARLVLPEARAGMLASRRRLVDVTCLGALAIGLLVAGLVLPVPS